MRLAVRVIALCLLLSGCTTTAPQAPEPSPEVPTPEVPAVVPPEPIPDSVPEPTPPSPEEPPSPPPSVEPQLPVPPQRTLPESCTYRTYQWSTARGKAVNRRTVHKKYSGLTAEEKAPDFDISGCTVCSEDQVEVAIEGLPAIKVCWFYAPQVKQALEALHADRSFRIQELVGYRCGQTRGRLVNGLRTQFSNHSFGTAIDINASSNGLYRRCDLKGKVPTSAKDIARCKKGIGGVWNPKKNRKSTITPASKAYQLFTTIVAWKWGGEIPGRTKDFMHFSVDGF